MHTYIPSHGLQRSWHSCPRRVNASNKNTPGVHWPRTWNMTTSMVGLRNGHIRKNLTQKGEPQRYSWGTQKKKNLKIAGAHFHLDWNRTNVLDNTNSIGHLSWKPNNNRTFLSCSLEQCVSNGKFSAVTENNTQSNSSTVHTGLKSN